MKLKAIFFFLISVSFISPLLFAGNTGKLAGTVTDGQSGEKLFAINVVILKTTLGAATDANGAYLINNIEPGIYTVIFSGVGYQKKEVQGVRISSDFTTRLDMQLSQESMTTGVVTVVADNPLVRKDLTSSQTSVDMATIQSLPVESVDQLLALQAGINKGTGGELHIRGGRSNEIEYTINGVSIQNPFDNTKTVEISTKAIQELSVISGTFNAEYGNALSGVINTVTREGDERYHVFLSGYSGDYLSNRTNPFFNIGKVDVLNNSVTEATVGGPIPFTDNTLSFFSSLKYNNYKGYLYGIRQNTIYDSVYKNIYNPTDIRISSTGDGAIIPMNTSKDINATMKLTIRPTSAMKINLDGIFSNSKYQSYNHDLKYNPDANPTAYEWGFLGSAELRHAISASTFYSFKAGYNFSNYKRYLFPLLYSDGSEVDYYPGLGTSNYLIDQRYQPEHKLNTTIGVYTFYSGGTINSHSYRRSGTAELKFDLTSQLNRNHELKIGGQFKQPNLNYEYFNVIRDTTRYLVPTILGTNTTQHDLYTKNPIQFSAYVQDKMEFESIILNVGVRYDYFKSRSLYGPDVMDPVANLTDAEAKQSVSPRVGISFPITDQGIIHFSYGHFYQLPSFAYLYANPDFKTTSGIPTYGNANLNPEKNVSYEMGLQQQLTDNIAFNVTGFYKDVRDLLALRQFRVSGSSTYYRYANEDYGSIKGIVFSFQKRRTPDDGFSVTVDYTYQIAEGNETNSDAFFFDVSSGRQTEKVPVALNWDQRHLLNATFSFGKPQDYNITLVGKIGTGLPYTPEYSDRQIYLRSNSERRPSQMTFDLLAEKDFSFGDYVVTVFLKVFNLFDALVERLVYNDSGRSTYTLEESKGTAQEINRLAEIIPGAHSATEYFIRPQYYAPPREVRLGLSIEF